MAIINLLVKYYVKLRLRTLRKAGLVVGDDCRMGNLPDFGSEPYLIFIGKHVAMASGVSFITHDGGTYVFRHLDRYKKVIKYGRITVLDNCVIGERAMILPGVIIGPNSVVAAGSVVTRNVPPGVLVAGNPAKPIMTVHQYAEWALAATPDYNESEYKYNKREFLMKFQMRGSGSNQPPASDRGVASDAD